MVFRYDSALRYGIVQSKKWGEVLVVPGMFCNSSKLYVLSVHCRLHSCSKWSAGQQLSVQPNWCWSQPILVPT